MEITQTTAPTSEPITLDQARNFLRVDANSDNTLIEALITAARMQAETYTGRQLMLATWRYSLSGWPACGEIVLPYPPLASIAADGEGITYYDTNGDQQTWAATDYQTSEHEPVRIMPAYGEVFPSARGQYNSIQVTYQAGYSSASAVPAIIKMGLRQLITLWYEQRFVADQPAARYAVMPQYVMRLFDGHRVFWNQPV